MREYVGGGPAADCFARGPGGTEGIVSQNSRMFECSPEDVFDVLSDGASYASWVVGAARIRQIDAGWPAEGTEIHHSVGAWPLMLSDTTHVKKIDRPREVVLKVRAWPAGAGEVRLYCEAEPGGGRTKVTLEEEVTEGPARLVPGPITHFLLALRNVETLKRLAYLAEARVNR